MTDKLRIHTEYVNPPIPDRNCDWYARWDFHDGDTDLTGHGKTEAEAVLDLFGNTDLYNGGDEERMLIAEMALGTWNTRAHRQVVTPLEFQETNNNPPTYDTGIVHCGRYWVMFCGDDPFSTNGSCWQAIRGHRLIVGRSESKEGAVSIANDHNRDGILSALTDAPPPSVSVAEAARVLLLQGGAPPNWSTNVIGAMAGQTMQTLNVRDLAAMLSAALNALAAKETGDE